MQASDFTVLIVDDDKNIRRTLQMALQAEGYKVLAAADVPEAFRYLAEHEFDIALLDIRLGDVSGLDLYRRMRASGFEIPVIFMSGHASLGEAVQTVKMGAFDFLEKPFSPEKIFVTIQRCLEHQIMRRKLSEMTSETRSQPLLGDSQLMRKTQAALEKVAATDATVLIQGESGTGKEVLARLICENSKRRDQPFIKVNCASIPENLVESELFGFEKGSFTGAIQGKKGLFELAHRGTLFLDEIGDMSIHAQAKILRAIQNQEIQKVGAERITKIDVRIIAATHRDLKQMAQDGTFREDLYYRLSVVQMGLPALRERKEDLPLLINHFLAEYARKHGLALKTVSDEARIAMEGYAWPGNIRELQNLMERLVILGGNPILVEDLPDFVFSSRQATTGAESAGGTRSGEAFAVSALRPFRDRVERQFILETLRHTNGNISQAARLLEIERTFLHKKIAQYKIEKREYFT